MTRTEQLESLAVRVPDRMWVRVDGRVVGFVTEHLNGWRGYSANLGMGCGPFITRESAEDFAASPPPTLVRAEG